MESASIDLERPNGPGGWFTRGTFSRPKARAGHFLNAPGEPRESDTASGEWMSDSAESMRDFREWMRNSPERMGDSPERMRDSREWMGHSRESATPGVAGMPQRAPGMRYFRTFPVGRIRTGGLLLTFAPATGQYGGG